LSGLYVIDSVSSLPTSVNQVYASLNIMSAWNQIEFARSYEKIDMALSYIGGLVGALVSIIFFMQKYTEISFEIHLGSSLLLNNDR